MGRRERAIGALLPPDRAVVATRTTTKWTGFEDGLHGFEGTGPERNAIEKDFMSPKVDDPAAFAMQALIALRLELSCPCSGFPDAF
jgi:hypothetical protein